MYWDIRPHKSTNKSNIQVVDKHFNRMGLVMCAAVREVNNKCLSYIKFHESEIKKEKRKGKNKFIKKFN